jgi:hypothetical protein
LYAERSSPHRKSSTCQAWNTLLKDQYIGSNLIREGTFLPATDNYPTATMLTSVSVPPTGPSDRGDHPSTLSDIAETETPDLASVGDIPNDTKADSHQASSCDSSLPSSTVAEDSVLRPKTETRPVPTYDSGTIPLAVAELEVAGVA